MSNLKRIKYSSPAVPPIGINKDVVYNLEKVERKYFVNQIEFSLDLLKIKFTPLNFKWSDLIQKPKKKIVKKDIVEDLNKIENEIK